MSTTESAVPPVPVQQGDDAKVVASVDHWKRKLLDLTKRNRALNFRATKVSTITVVDEQPAEVFRRLYLQGKPMRFHAAAEADGAAAKAKTTAASPVVSPEATAGSPSSTPATAADGSTAAPAAGGDAGAVDTAVVDETAADATTADGSAAGEVPEGYFRVDDSGAPMDDLVAELEEEDTTAAPSFAPYEAASLDARHRDDVLQTTAAPDKLDVSLRRIDEQARETLEEQGVNALFLALGMLHYREAKDAEQVFKAPLVLLPVELERKSAGTGYVAKPTDDDPIVNPALAELLRKNYGIALPDLPAADEIADDYDLQTFLQAVRDAVAGQAGWTVTTEVHLGLFAFQKFVMYKDLEGNAGSFAGHRLIRQLVTRRGDSVVGLPDDVREMELDAEFPPERTFQVVDADSSQLRAIAAVSRDHDLVLEGPPGTGKSQTITNLIAQALAAGKTVLFVAEKMAALQVVHTRLVNAGLGDFCLELHSSKANKRAVVREIGRALDNSLQRPKPSDGATARLDAVRSQLTAYVEAVHTPYGAAELTPYRGFGELMALQDAPKLRLEASVDAVTRAQLEEAVRDLEALATAAAEVGDVAAHPWRDSGRTFWSSDDLDDARALLPDLRTKLAEVVRLAAEVQAAFGLPPVRTFADVETAAEVAEVMGRSPGAPLAVLRSEAWNAPPREAAELIERGRRVAGLRQRVGERFTSDVVTQDHAADVAFIEEKESGFFRFLNFLNGRHRLVKRRWLAYRLPSYSASLLEQAEEMKRVDELRRERAALEASDAAARQLFGGLWQGEKSAWDALDGYVRWVVEFRGLCVAHGLDDKATELASRPHPDVSLANQLRDAASAASKTLGDLRALGQWPAEWLAIAPLAEVDARAAALEGGVALAPRWAAFEMVRQKVAAGVAKEVLAPAFAGEVAFADLPRAFQRAFHQKWVNAVVQQREPLKGFATLTHEQRVAEFRRLDEQVLRENRDQLVARLRDAVQERLRTPEAKEALPFLQGQMARQRGHAPLRTVMKRGGAAIRAIKPCFLMSPLTVAQLLDGGLPSFDLVIFDEASQLPAEDAVGAIVRGARLVVVGDPNQLPPTNFFAVMAGQQEVQRGDDGMPLFEDAESILEEFMAAGVPKTRLRWHYRSTHESLITFSNVSFYDADLHTFPSVETASHAAGLVFEHLPDGVYEGKGLNLVEARRVADAVVRHAKEAPELSLGVGTFNLRQQIAIQDELELRRRQDPALEPFFARDRAEPFFVKNLENIQGDERDVVFLSVTYARARDGRLRYNFGPINGENGWRRLNVLTTRARRRMVVFSSMRGDDINLAATASRGARLLREFLLYAERGQLEGLEASAAAETESVFEREVLEELTKRGLKLQPQVGVAGYRIDLAVLDDETSGRYVCGIECDGAAYHASQTARDRDRLRQQVLENRGWEIHRVWSTDWFKDRDGQTERILRLVEESRVRARQKAADAQEAAARADADRAQAEAERAASAPPVQTLAGDSADGTTSSEPSSAAPSSSARTQTPAPGPLDAEPYRMADATQRFQGDLVTAHISGLLSAIDSVVEAEAPVHFDDLSARVAAMWGLSRAGSRVEARIAQALDVAAQAGKLERRGDFVWRADGSFALRSRAGTRIPAERIAPEEYRDAVVRVLRATGGLPRKELTAQVRALFGFSRTGARLEEAIGAVIDALLAEGAAGEGSTGVRLRE
ncbi:MAG TPA: DUF3320 domain-containing protein [Longimicrobium sp.]|nr:DUF3320 domain-containing protein [Longimicrobium sp.]